MQGSATLATRILARSAPGGEACALPGQLTLAHPQVMASGDFLGGSIVSYAAKGVPPADSLRRCLREFHFHF